LAILDSKTSLQVLGLVAANGKLPYCVTAASWHSRTIIVEGNRQMFSPRLSIVFACVLAALSGHHAIAQKFQPNYDEAKVPEYQLPPIIDDSTDQAADFAAAWNVRRDATLKIFAEQMYGTQPDLPYSISIDRFESGDSVHGKALRQQFHVTLATDHAKHSIDLLVFTPKNATKPVPCFLGLNFHGNHTTVPDDEVAITGSWCRTSEAHGASDHRASAEGRGKSSSRWPIEMIIDAGYGVATTYCGDIDPDTDDEFQNGVHALFPAHRPSAQHPERWGTVSAWAWGLSRMLDCIQTEVAAVDGRRVVVIGHSRLGKTALWAGASDARFAAAISNDSGCGGAAISRRAIGETVERINSSFPHWFCPNFHQYDRNESSLPVDQHQLIALIAPRPVYVASASDDRWADPRGEFLAVRSAGVAYERLGKKPLALDAFPQANVSSIGCVSYHLRAGKHDINEWDWRNYIEFIGQLR